MFFHCLVNLMLEFQRVSLRNFICVLLSQCKNMREVKQIHTQILVSPTLSIQDHYFLVSRLLFFCAISESGSLAYATNVFHQINNPNLFMYNAMIRGHSSSVDAGTGSILLYKQMLRQGVRPNHLTFPFLVKECTERCDIQLGTSVHNCVAKIGFENDLFIQNSVVVMYSMCGDLKCARRVFDEMSTKDVVSWNSLLTGYLRCGALELALDLFRMMNERNVISWNSIITGLVQGGRPKEALDFFHEMQVLDDDTVRPDKITIASVISACASLGAIDQGKWVHSYIQRTGVECDMVIRTALVDMYGKCGYVEKAVKVFEDISTKDVFAWTVMISVFALHGHVKEAFDLFGQMQMQGVRPNHVTFVGLLSSCAHSGQVEKGCWCFNMMERVYSIKPLVEHCACMVDILGRAGLFVEAEKFIRSMPVEPDVYVWGALLGGCRMHGNVELGERVAHYLIELEPLNHSFYVVLTDIYAKGNRFNDAKRVRVYMEERGIKKPVPGCSMIEIDGIINKFSVKGSPEAKMIEINWVLTRISDEMKIKDPCLTVKDLIESI